MLLDGALFTLFFCSKGMSTAVFQYFCSCPVFHVMLKSFEGHAIAPEIDDHLIDALITNRVICVG